MGADEAEALRDVADAMDLQPAIFDSLADEGEGAGPGAFAQACALGGRADRAGEQPSRRRDTARRTRSLASYPIQNADKTASHISDKDVHTIRRPRTRP